jgi:hypothetical protein
MTDGVKEIKIKIRIKIGGVGKDVPRIDNFPPTSHLEADRHDNRHYRHSQSRRG